MCSKLAAKSLKTACVLLAIALVFWSLPLSILAAGAAGATINVSSQTVSPGQTFSVNISLQPNSPITGAQVTLAFNPGLVTATNVAEGNLFKQTGADSFFIPGKIDNVKGLISGICGIIVGSGKNVSTSGVLAVVTFSTGQNEGSSPLPLSNVIVGDQNGNSVATGITNGQVVIARPVPTSPPPPPASGPSSPPVGGGGGFGGGGGTGTGPVQAATMPVDASGHFTQDYSVKSPDGEGSLSIQRGTSAKTQEGTPPGAIKFTNVTIGQPGSGPQVDPNIVGHVFDLSPEGTTFDPPITLVVNYDPGIVPPGIGEKDLVIGYWDPVGLKWEPMSDSKVDIAQHQIAVHLSHFSIYAVLAPQPSPASITLSDLNVPTGELKTGQELTASVLAANSGESDGTVVAILKIDGSVVDTRDTTVEAKSQRAITFTIALDKEGTHEIDINGLKAEVKTLAPVPLPVVTDNHSQPDLAAMEETPISASPSLDEQKAIDLLQSDNLALAKSDATLNKYVESTQPKTTEFRLSLFALAVGTALLLIVITVVIVLLKSRNLHRYYS